MSGQVLESSLSRSSTATRVAKDGSRVHGISSVSHRTCPYGLGVRFATMDHHSRYQVLPIEPMREGLN